jgi:hypothetical protein
MLGIGIAPGARPLAERSSMTRSLVIVFLTSALSLGTAGAILARWHGELLTTANTPVAIVEIRIGHPLYDFDPRNDRAMAAYATDIFIGRVLSQTGNAGAPTSAPGQEVPQSQLAVEVLHAVKGEAEGVVTINQVGGLDAQAKRMMLFEGDALLRPGASELFLVVQVPQMEWYQIVAAGYGHLPADDAGKQAALVDRFARAVAAAETDEGSSDPPWHGERS